jgi:hypothetical protein
MTTINCDSPLNIEQCLVEWNDINKTKSSLNYFALSLSNPKLSISFGRNNRLLDKIPFCHLTQYCRSNMAVDIARILKVSTSPASIKYKFGIQVPKGIKNAIDLDKKNGNQLWQEAIKTELKQLTDYQTIIVQDSGEDILTGYQKIPYHMVFDVKYDLRYEARLVAGGNWTVNDKEDIYSGVVRMDTVRIMTFAARFHEHLSESLLRLGFKKTKHTLTYGWWTSHLIMNN